MHKSRVLVFVLALGAAGLGWNNQAHAVGCITGGIAGAAAGHMVHHGVLGAIGGCVAGHEYKKHHQQGQMQQSGGSYQPQNGQSAQ